MALFTVRSAMTEDVVALPIDANVDDALELLVEHRVSGLPVVDNHGRLAGVLSEQDLLTLLSELASVEAPAIDYATRRVVSVTPETSLVDAVDLFLQRRFRRLPVVDGDNRLVGLISRRDVIRFIRQVRRRLSRELSSQAG